MNGRHHKLGVATRYLDSKKDCPQIVLRKKLNSDSFREFWLLFLAG